MTPHKVPSELHAYMNKIKFKQSFEYRLARSVKAAVHLSYSIYSRRTGAPHVSPRLTLRPDMTYKLRGAFYVTSGSYIPPRDKLTDKEDLFDRRFAEALCVYGKLTIGEIMASQNPVVRALGMLDTRLSVARLLGIQTRNEAPIVKKLYAFRCKREGLIVNEEGDSVVVSMRPRHERFKSRIVSWQDILTRHKRRHQVDKILIDVENGSYSTTNEDTLSEQIFVGADNPDTKDQYCEAIKFLKSCSKLIAKDYVIGVNELIHQHPLWVRPLGEWKPATHNIDRQFSSLARHLLVRFSVPIFMDKAWFSGNTTHQDWFTHIGSGRNIRTAKNLPIDLTKSMAHYFSQAPEHYSIEAALRWGQIIAMGGDKYLCDAVAQTRLVETFTHDHFWLSVFKFFIDNPMLDRAHVQPIVDYIHNRKFEDEVVFVAPGVAQRRAPVQPHFSMKGRNAESLLRQIESWHEKLGIRRSAKVSHWKKSHIKDFFFVEGSETKENMRVWRIFELLSHEELQQEGRHMNHCVATYASSCHRGRSSIWSMSVETHEGIKKVLTIEVRSKEMDIEQVRGKHNRRATAKEREIIHQWAAREGLTWHGY